MALPIHEANRRSEYKEGKIIDVDFSPTANHSSSPADLALLHFFANGNDTYVKRWVKDNIAQLPQDQLAHFLDTLARRPHEFFDMLTEFRGVALDSIINEFLTRDWD